jgi:hypothetical protein
MPTAEFPLSSVWNGSFTTSPSVRREARIDPLTGETSALAERVQVKPRRSSRKYRTEPALHVIARMGRSGASASALAKDESLGVAIGVALVVRGAATVTRNNRFILKKWEKEILSRPTINWDDDQRDGDQRNPEGRVGMVEPPRLPPIKRKV